jgi:hypothetical protein
MKRGTALLVACFLAQEVRAASRVEWSDGTARTLEPGRLEVGLFAPARLGVGEGFELAAHPLLFAVFPALELTTRWLDREVVFATRQRLSYPTRFIDVVSREGALGLLPDETEPPILIGLDVEAVVSTAWTGPHWVTALGGVAVAPRLAGEEPPVLDFPFLYTRFAAVNAPAVPRFAAAFSGPIAGRFHYASELRVVLIPLEPFSAAVETDVQLRYRPGRRVQLKLGLRREHVRYPVGFRTHALPYADIAVAF